MSLADCLRMTIPIPVPPPELRELADALAGEPAMKAIGAALVLDLAAPVLRQFKARDFSNPRAIDDEARRERYALIGRVLPPVREGSVFEATPKQLIGAMRPMQPRPSWQVIEPAWLRRFGESIGVAFDGVAFERARRDVVAAIDRALESAAKRTAWLAVWWLRRLRSYVAETVPMDGHSEVYTAMLAVKLLGALG
jgi:hypothetical protein